MEIMSNKRRRIKSWKICLRKIGGNFVFFFFFFFFYSGWLATSSFPQTHCRSYSMVVCIMIISVITTIFFSSFLFYFSFLSVQCYVEADVCCHLVGVLYEIQINNFFGLSSNRFISHGKTRRKRRWKIYRMNSPTNIIPASKWCKCIKQTVKLVGKLFDFSWIWLLYIVHRQKLY